MTGRPPVLRRALPWIVALGTAIAFLPALRGEFLNWDDDKNFLENPSYRGLGPENLRWMATTFLMGHYHPLTWITLGLDYTIWGMNPFGYHLTSILLHAAGAVLLYYSILVLLRLSGRPDVHWPAAIGALLYAVHPLRVESVAWITERRDVTCGLFTQLTLFSYLKKIEEERADRDGRRWGALSVIAFAAALLSKALAITLPGVLLLIDVFPLGRFVPGARARVLREKLPYLALSLADAAVMFLAMRHIDAVQASVSFDLPARAAQAAYGLCFYLLKAAWPTGLGPLYRIDPHLNPWAPGYLGAMLAVTAITALLFSRRKQWPGLLVAWLSYVLLLLPVLGIAVTGRQIAADRYTYLALIPVTILAALGLSRIVAPPRRTAAFALSIAAVIALGAVTWRQSGYWKDSMTLWNRELAIDYHCSVAWQNRGDARAALGDVEGALADYDASLGLDPGDAGTWYNRGALKAQRGNPAAAVADFTSALERNPGHVNALSSRAVSRADLKDVDGARADLEAALRLDPGSPQTVFNCGLVRFRLGDMPGADADFTRCLALSPDFAQAYTNRAQVRLRLGRRDLARQDLDRAIAIRPEHAQTWADRALIHSMDNNPDAALSDLTEALRRRPDPAYYLRRATLYGMKGNLDAAVLDLDAVLRLNPGSGDAYARRGMARLEQNRKTEAAADLEKALELYPPQGPQRASLLEALQRARSP